MLAHVSFRVFFVGFGFTSSLSHIISFYTLQKPFALGRPLVGYYVGLVEEIGYVSDLNVRLCVRFQYTSFPPDADQTEDIKRLRRSILIGLGSRSIVVATTDPRCYCTRLYPRAPNMVLALMPIEGRAPRPPPIQVGRCDISAPI
ncbi:hypothetical protein BV25DRAFT_143780 [Artomyces pyxidatus]|uniref:Uncharacterized protein n=1 Tax=Artomyces pyxidatus TaxID=48021 RepID=A0ACB8TAH8_9AGAM|nr:hypothetical protein BV25DRAFT_143780 [Artomyces pyxidatus]